MGFIDRDDVEYDEDQRDDQGDQVDVFPGVSTREERPKAILCVMPEWGGDKNVSVWVPKSMIHDDSEVYKHPCDSSKLVVKSWWTEKALAEYAEKRRKTSAVKSAMSRKSDEVRRALASKPKVTR